MKLKVIVNGTHIYGLEKAQPVIVPLLTNTAHIVVTDGFHITYPMEVSWRHHPVQHLSVACAIEDDHLIGGLFLLLLFYAAAITSGVLFLKIMSFVPIAAFLFLYYFRRKSFLRVWIV